MSNETDNLSKEPRPDTAEQNAYFPSPYSLTQYTAPKTDFDGANYANPYTGKLKILVIATDERYVIMKNGKMFSTGNHPVETLLPMFHMHNAGFEIDVATLSGNPVKFEMWAMPNEDEAVLNFYRQYLPQFKKPMKLADVLKDNFSNGSPYIGVFIPGGHGALAGIPHSREVKQVLKWAMDNDRYVITLCHGPAGLLAAGVDENAEDYIYKGYKICVFPDALDEGPNISIGYIPGKLEWLVAENLEKLGVEVLNEGITGQCHQDRKLITGDSPLASNNLGRMAAEALLKEVSNL